MEGGQYCGEIGDGCGNVLNCGGCPGDWVCVENVCVGGADCVPSTECQVGGAQFCGAIGDGCGRALECGDCVGGETCIGGVCVPEGCVPLTCDPAGGSFCGTIGDGCGGVLNCGVCAGDTACEDSVCVAGPGCVPSTVCQVGDTQFCGTVGDGCARPGRGVNRSTFHPSLLRETLEQLLARGESFALLANARLFVVLTLLDLRQDS